MPARPTPDAPAKIARQLTRLPEVASAPEPRGWLHDNALTPFLEEIRAERIAEIERIARHVEPSLTDLLNREDQNIGRFAEEAERGVEGAAGNLKQAEERHATVLSRRERRRQELERQRSLTLQGVERIASVLVFPPSRPRATRGPQSPPRRGNRSDRDARGHRP